MAKRSEYSQAEAAVVAEVKKCACGKPATRRLLSHYYKGESLVCEEHFHYVEECVCSPQRATFLSDARIS